MLWQTGGQAVVVVVKTPRGYRFSRLISFPIQYDKHACIFSFHFEVSFFPPKLRVKTKHAGIESAEKHTHTRHQIQPTTGHEMYTTTLNLISSSPHTHNFFICNGLSRPSSSYFCFYTVDVLAAFHQSDRWPGRAPSARPWFLCLAHRELLQIYFFFTVFFLLSSGLYRKKGVTTRPGRGLMARRYDVSRRLSSVENAVRTLSMVKRENSHAILQKIKKEEIGKIKKNKK